MTPPPPPPPTHPPPSRAGGPALTPGQRDAAAARRRPGGRAGYRRQGAPLRAAALLRVPTWVSLHAAATTHLGPPPCRRRQGAWIHRGHGWQCNWETPIGPRNGLLPFRALMEVPPLDVLRSARGHAADRLTRCIDSTALCHRPVPLTDTCGRVPGLLHLELPGGEISGRQRHIHRAGECPWHCRRSNRLPPGTRSAPPSGRALKGTADPA